MTPGSIAGIAKLNGLNVAALTDHNACDNCPSFFAACACYGVVPVAGMELTTSEDVHLICLFRTLEDAITFAAEVRKKRNLIRNRPEIFGRQLIIGPDDEPVGEEPDLLINATALSLQEAALLVRRYDGAAVPAHIDRESNGILSTLGGMPEEPDFPTVEYREPERILELEREHPILKAKRRIVSSDAHRLWEISDSGYPLNLPGAADANAQTVRDTLIDYLSGGQSGGHV
ncbi:hypothetical protein SDC9_113152 [bioreactor metagenome]|uniref:Polymerase/histidinol phosphatase N-terminal domain-containing protein n=1 Tax=bioreactor metagenome TaxID=1076179 RepID=A0A645BLV3_9ZZZZ